MFEEKCYKLVNGSMLDELDNLCVNSVDSIVTDPPYELNFMNSGWDNAGISFQSDTWRKCLRVLKPGGYLLAFGGSRTFHRIAVAIEDAGFEIRDTIMWLYGSGFPKSMNIGKAIEGKLMIGSANVKDIKKLDGEKIPVTCGFNKTGVETGYRDKEYEMVKTDVVYHTELGKQYSSWGTALKPSFEPIIVARKPLDGSCVDNVIKWGVGGINIDECRVGTDDMLKKGGSLRHNSGDTRNGKSLGMFQEGTENTFVQNENGRFSANTILTYDDTDFEEVCGGFPDTVCNKRTSSNNKDTEYTNTYTPPKAIYTEDNTYGDSGSASRYFYCAKASRKDRDEGCEYLDNTYSAVSNQAQAEYKRGNTDFTGDENKSFNKVYVGKNTHPTVKPTELMQYLIRLVTPIGGVVLDPFMGSGSTGKATMFENRERNASYKFIGIELDSKYIKIAEARIYFALNGFTYMPEDTVVRVTDNTKNKTNKPLISLW